MMRDISNIRRHNQFLANTNWREKKIVEHSIIHTILINTSYAPLNIDACIHFWISYELEMLVNFVKRFLNLFIHIICSLQLDLNKYGSFSLWVRVCLLLAPMHGIIDILMPNIIIKRFLSDEYGCSKWVVFTIP